VAAETPALRQQAGDVFRRWRERLAELLEAGGVPKGRGPAMAASLISACEGGVILARGEHAMEPFELVTGEQLRQIREAVRSGS